MCSHLLLSFELSRRLEPLFLMLSPSYLPLVAWLCNLGCTRHILSCSLSPRAAEIPVKWRWQSSPTAGVWSGPGMDACPEVSQSGGAVSGPPQGYGLHMWVLWQEGKLTPDCEGVCCRGIATATLCAQEAELLRLSVLTFERWGNKEKDLANSSPSEQSLAAHKVLFLPLNDPHYNTPNWSAANIVKSSLILMQLSYYSTTGRYGTGMVGEGDEKIKNQKRKKEKRHPLEIQW